MADKHDLNDDYQFADIDSGNNQLDPELNGASPASETVSPPSTMKRNKIIRNALIAVIIFVLAVLIYNFFTAKKTPTTPTPPKITPVIPKTAPVVKPIVPPVVQPPQVDTTVLEKKINALELSEQNMRTEVSALGNQMTTLNTNINEINTQLSKLNQTIDTLAATVAQQANAMTVLETRLQKPKPISGRRIHHHIPAPIFYIQAVVPGRAWIISTNGATLTVREGSTIPGYGVVKLIDAQQGRVITGSGRVIKFSQDDS